MGPPAVSGRLPKDVLAGPWLAGFCIMWPRAPAAAEAVAVAAVCSLIPPRPAVPAPVAFMPPLPAPKGNLPGIMCAERLPLHQRTRCVWPTGNTQRSIQRSRRAWNR